MSEFTLTVSVDEDMLREDMESDIKNHIIHRKMKLDNYFKNLMKDQLSFGGIKLIKIKKGE